MTEFDNKLAVVVGLGNRGLAACELLHRLGARVVAVDRADTPALREAAQALSRAGARLELGATTLPDLPYDLAVLSPAVSPQDPILSGLAQRGVRVIGELELGFEQARCLSIVVAGTNGKHSTAALIQRGLTQEHRRAALCGATGQPACAAANQSRELDFLIFAASARQLEAAQSLRPSVAVLLNLAAQPGNGYACHADYVRAHARLFAQQQSSDWAILQREALTQCAALGLAPRGKVVTFSAEDREADLYFERGLLISRIEGWSGPLLDMDHCRLRGPHNAENIMAALLVGRALRLPLDAMAGAIKSAAPLPHCCELVAEREGVRFISDARAGNMHALSQALRTIPQGTGGQPNLWLIAGGGGEPADFHAVGPLVSQRVKGAFLLGEAREALRAAWGLFTPCMLAGTLAEAVAQAAKRAVPGDVVLYSAGCAEGDAAAGGRDRGEVYRQAVAVICRGDKNGHPY
jgi:UDP-N-acetylmuramoylalanine--D-glutamate ligase